MKNVIYFILGSLLVFTSCKKDASNPISQSEAALTVTYSGKVYHTVKIGKQTWLKENLNVGVMIDSMQNHSNNGVIEKYCYGNDTANCNKYGGLYQWNEAMAYDTIEGAKGICPDGWHMPTKAEFDTLRAVVNYNGNALKSVGQGMGNGTGTDSSGFSALLAGSRNYYGIFNLLGSSAFLWSSRGYYAASAYSMYFLYNGSNIYMNDGYEDYGFSIRCIKDE